MAAHNQTRTMEKVYAAEQLVRNSVNACPLLALDQIWKEAADTAHQPNPWYARVK